MKRVRVPIAVLVLLFVTSAAFAEDKAVCAVCGPREGAGFEPVEAVATYRGKQYFFCSLKCKVDFLKNPAEFLSTGVQTPAPEFELTALVGDKVRLNQYRGNVVLLDFWATYCRPCMTALPKLEALQQRLGPFGLRLIGISVDEREALVKKAVAMNSVSYPILRGTSEVWNAYQVNALPTLVLIDRGGKIIGRFGGEADETLMIKAIEEAVAR
jgi:thiol-disulfide isomerase/thioredoxin